MSNMENGIPPLRAHDLKKSGHKFQESTLPKEQPVPVFVKKPYIRKERGKPAETNSTLENKIEETEEKPITREEN